MKLLLTSDLHRQGKKLLWLLEEAPPHDALMLAGDQLQIFSNTPRHEQIGGVRQWTQAVLASGKSLVACSGNHDFYLGENTPREMASPKWMLETTAVPGLISDGRSARLDLPGGSIAVTTIPWPVAETFINSDRAPSSYIDFVKVLLHEGKRMQAEGLPWMVLIHEPPAGHPVAGTYCAVEADFTRRLLESALPDFSLHGHIHDAPEHEGGHWWAKVGETIALNAGQTPPWSLPHAILLQIESDGTWHAQRLIEGQICGLEFTTNGKLGQASPFVEISASS